MAFTSHPRCQLATARQRSAYLGHSQSASDFRRHPLFSAFIQQYPVQGWFSSEYRDRAPYWLYVLSNAGPLLALVSYPFLLEPNLTIRAQAWLWSAGYVAFALSVAYLAWRTYHWVPHFAAQKDKSAQPAEEARPGIVTHILWIATDWVGCLCLDFVDLCN